MRLSAIDMNLLKILHALVEERNVTRAAARLGRSQPAVSNALARLRRLLGDPILVRVPGGLALTPRVQALREPLRDMMSLAQSCLGTQTDFAPATATGVLRISMPDRLSLPISPALLEHVSRLAPGMSLHVRTADRAQALQLLADDRVDLVLGWFARLPGHLRSDVMAEEEFRCLLRREHPGRANGGLDQAALFAYPHLLVSATGGRSAIFDELIADKNLKRDVRMSVSNFSTVPYLLASSDMIGVFTELVTGVFERSFNLVALPVPVDVGTLATRLVWHARYEGDARHIWLRRQVAAVFAEHARPLPA